METTQEKPRVKYSAFLAQQLGQWPGGSVACLFERYIREMAKRGHTVGKSQGYCMSRMQREPIGGIDARKLTKQDVKAHARFRKEAGVIPATVMKDLVNLRVVLNYAGSEWDDDCEGITGAAVDVALPSLTKNGLVGKSEPRSRRPTDDEHETLLAFFAKQNTHPRTVVDMVKVARWQRVSARRIGETCKILWSDWNREDHTILVRKMKDPRNRDKNKVVALPDKAQAMLCELWETRDQNEPRIFPYNAQVCSARYTHAKKETGIDGLHLHDSRRDCATRLIEEDGFNSSEVKNVTGHETTAILDRVYIRTNPARFKDGPIAKRLAA